MHENREKATSRKTRTHISEESDSGVVPIKAMIAREGNAAVLAEIVHHRFLLQELMDHLEFVERKIFRLEKEIFEGINMEFWRPTPAFPNFPQLQPPLFRLKLR
jgi:hypothetical protein